VGASCRWTPNKSNPSARPQRGPTWATCGPAVRAKVDTISSRCHRPLSVLCHFRPPLVRRPPRRWPAAGTPPCTLRSGDFRRPNLPMSAAPAGRPLRCPAVAGRDTGPTHGATVGGNFRQLPLRIALSLAAERGSVFTWVIAPRPRDRRRTCNPRSASSSANCSG